MPQTLLAKRAVRRAQRRTTIVARVKRSYKEVLHAMRQGGSNLSSAYRALDRAAKKGVIHPRKAARLKARLSRFAAKASPPPGTTKPKKRNTST